VIFGVKISEDHRMKKLIALVFGICSTMAFADVGLSVQAVRNGIEQEKIACELNKETDLWYAVVEDLLVVAAVIAQEENDNIDVLVKVLGANEKGEVVEVAEQMFNTVWGKAGVLTVSSDEQKESLEIKVVATR
jgi:hypothetical protein